MRKEWHVSDDVLTAWLSGTAGPAASDSAEQHLLSCPECRERTAGATIDLPDIDLTEVWAGIADRIEPQRRPWPARTGARLGLSDADVAQLAATPALRISWISSLAVVLLFTVVASGWRPVQALYAYLLLAPLIPVLGVATSYGPHTDPTYELVIAAPYSKSRLVLLRSTAVLVGCAPLTIAAGLLLGPWWIAVAWLIPALAFVLLTLTVSTWQPPVRAAVAVAALWSMASALALAAGDLLALVGPAAMGVFGAAIVASGGIVILRRDQLAMTGHLA